MTEAKNSVIQIEKDPIVEFESSVLQQIRQHARSSMDKEICGVLLGACVDGVSIIKACIKGENASQGGAHVTFTQETWAHIYQVKDALFPDDSIMGWYHSHPGFGIFLSDYDLFIHDNFFGASHQVAWVFDPHSDEEGCFGWTDKEIVPLSKITIRKNTSKPTADDLSEKSTDKGDAKAKKVALSEGSNAAGCSSGNNQASLIMRVVILTGSIILVAVVGFAVFSYLFSPKRTQALQVPIKNEIIGSLSPTVNTNTATNEIHKSDSAKATNESGTNMTPEGTQPKREK